MVGDTGTPIWTWVIIVIVGLVMLASLVGAPKGSLQAKCPYCGKRRKYQSGATFRREPVCRSCGREIVDPAMKAARLPPAAAKSAYRGPAAAMQDIPAEKEPRTEHREGIEMPEASDGTDMSDRLIKLAELRASGALTEEEFKAAKAELMGSITVSPPTIEEVAITPSAQGDATGTPGPFLPVSAHDATATSAAGHKKEGTKGITTYQLIAVAAALVAGGYLFWNAFGGSNDKPVPSVEGQRLDVAITHVEDAGFEYEVIGGGVFGVLAESAWTVCDQEPGPGATSADSVRLIVDRTC